MSETDIVASVIIPTYNRPGHLARCLASLKKTTFPVREFEIIVVEDNLRETAKQVVTDFMNTPGIPETVYLNQESRGPAAARNRGARTARGAFLVFTDDDCQPAPEWLAALIKNLEDLPEHAGIGGLVKPLRSDTTLQKYFDFRSSIEKPPVEHGEISYLITANAAYRKTAFESVNGFNESFRWPGGEDPDLGIRLRKQGYRLEFSANACVYHDYSSKISSYLLTRFHYGRGKYRIRKQHFPQSIWSTEPTLLHPLRIITQMKTLKAYMHEFNNIRLAIIFWTINYFSDIFELTGALYESVLTNMNITPHP